MFEYASENEGITMKFSFEVGFTLEFGALNCVEFDNKLLFLNCFSKCVLC